MVTKTGSTLGWEEESTMSGIAKKGQTAEEMQNKTMKKERLLSNESLFGF